MAKTHKNKNSVIKSVVKDVPIVQCTTHLMVRDGVLTLCDSERPGEIVANGIRRTLHQPENFDRTTHLFGNSVIYGAWSQDDETIASHLQMLVNDSADRRQLGFPDCRVVNHGITSESIENTYERIRRFQPQPGDIILAFNSKAASTVGNRQYHRFVKAIQETIHQKNAVMEANGQPPCPYAFLILPTVYDIAWPNEHERRLAATPTAIKAHSIARHFMNRILAAGCVCIDLQFCLNRPHAFGEVFMDQIHVNHIGNRVIAKAIWDKCLWPMMLNLCETAEPIENQYFAQIIFALREYFPANHAIRAWLDTIPKPNLAKMARIGAVVMNCNPFTLGHRHLIESALSEVDFLYVMVVEENQSTFSFDDRLAMVKAGTEHLRDKVQVIPSGKFVISSLTFKEYFTKDKQEGTIDASNDVALFGAIIAPRLGIRKRFLGEEPTCTVTRQYNETMQHMLPAMGCEVTIIPRLEIDGKPIIASMVRQHLREHDLESLKRLVPPSTYEFLTTAQR